MDQPILPQLEHGHTRLANSLLEVLIRTPFGGGQLRVVLAVIRLTYGWNRKLAPIRLRQLARLSGLSPRHTKRLVAELVRAQVLLRQRLEGRAWLGLNKRHWEWRFSTARAQGDGPGPFPGPTLSLDAGPDVSPALFLKTRKPVVKTAADPVETFFHRTLRRSPSAEERQTLQTLRSLTPTALEALFQDYAAACATRPGALS
jgi:phage replication O-like protein O